MTSIVVITVRRVHHSVSVHRLVLVLHLLTLLLELLLLLVAGLALILGVLLREGWATQTRLAPEFTIITAISHLITLLTHHFSGAAREWQRRLLWHAYSWVQSRARSCRCLRILGCHACHSVSLWLGCLADRALLRGCRYSLARPLVEEVVEDLLVPLI